LLATFTALPTAVNRGFRYAHFQPVKAHERIDRYIAECIHCKTASRPPRRLPNRASSRVGWWWTTGGGGGGANLYALEIGRRRLPAGRSARAGRCGGRAWRLRRGAPRRPRACRPRRLQKVWVRAALRSGRGMASRVRSRSLTSIRILAQFPPLPRAGTP
jgi:hypothetical protein